MVFPRISFSCAQATVNLKIAALMSLEPGTRLGHYEIIAAIGAGGMGEVYEAIDSRLDRMVASKSTPTTSQGVPSGNNDSSARPRRFHN